MLGGYWAYGVLGWGGYWGWDPVENSSLVPWLTGVALVHTMLVHRRTGKLLRTNLALAIVSFLLVVYSTFLTRSGILGDSSVHAFVDPGATVYWLLVFFLALTSGVGFGLLVARRASLRPATTDKRFISRETLLAAGTIALLLSAGVILFGTSLPLMSNSTVDAAFYDRMNLPVVVAMVLLIGMSLYMQWGTDTLGGMFKRSAKWIVVSILVTGGIAFAGVRDFDVFALVFASVFAVLVNLEFGWTQFRTDRGAIGGKLAHIGLGVFLLGVIASGRFNQTQHLSLELGKPVEALGHTLTYTGYKPTHDNKYAFSVDVRQGASGFTLLPVMFDGGQQGIMRNPDIASFFTSDFYISPVSLEQPHAEESDQAESFTIEKGKSITLGNVKATFVKFDMSAHSQDAMAQGSSNGMTVGSIIELSDGKVTETVTPLVVYGANGEQEHRIVASKLLNANIKLVSMNVGGMGAAASSVTIGIQAGAHTHDQTESLIVEASIKPFIGLVWAGTVVMFAGFFLAMLKRLKEA
jgi:cytochrome c-type biogenesis protein CcmF